MLFSWLHQKSEIYLWQIQVSSLEFTSFWLTWWHCSKCWFWILETGYGSVIWNGSLFVKGGISLFPVLQSTSARNLLFIIFPWLIVKMVTLVLNTRFLWFSATYYSTYRTSLLYIKVKFIHLVSHSFIYFLGKYVLRK